MKLPELKGSNPEQFHHYRPFPYLCLVQGATHIRSSSANAMADVLGCPVERTVV